MPVTLFVTGLTLLLTIVFSVLMGVTAAVYGGWVDRLVQFLAVLGGAVPSFIVAIGLVFALAVDVRLFPATGYVSPGQSVSQWASSLVLPVARAPRRLEVGGAASPDFQRHRQGYAWNPDYVRILDGAAGICDAAPSILEATCSAIGRQHQGRGPLRDALPGGHIAGCREQPHVDRQCEDQPYRHDERRYSPAE